MPRAREYNNQAEKQFAYRQRMEEKKLETLASLSAAARVPGAVRNAVNSGRVPYWVSDAETDSELIENLVAYLNGESRSAACEIITL
jgi:hypothetical protein